MLQQKLYNYSERIENKFGLYLSSLFISLLLIAITCIYTTPSLSTDCLGEYYEELSRNPFIFNENPVQYRILTPLIAYCLFLRGNLYIIMPLIFGLLLLASVYIYFRKKDFHPLDAICVTALIAFSSPILFTLHFQGYADTTSYFLVFLTYIFIEKRKLLPAFLFFTLSLINHEVNMFMAPFFLWVYFKQTKPINYWKPLLLLAISCFVIVMIRRYIDTFTQVPFGNDLYFKRDYFIWNFKVMYRLMPLGIFMCFKLFWGLPLIAIYKKAVVKSYKDTLTIILAIFCGCAPLVLSSDTSRIVGLSFLSILISVLILKPLIDGKLFTRYMLILIIMNFFVPSYYIGQTNAFPFYPLPIYLINKILLGIGFVIS
jgi:Gpi18-like mannosyltransferase